MSGLTVSKDLLQTIGSLDLFVIVIVIWIFKQTTSRIEAVEKCNASLKEGIAKLKEIILTDYVTHSAVNEKIKDIIEPIKEDIQSIKSKQ